jgi:hypothetical protein
LTLTKLASGVNATLAVSLWDSESLIAVVDGGHSARSDSRETKDGLVVGVAELEKRALVGHGEIDIVAVG